MTLKELKRALNKNSIKGDQIESVLEHYDLLIRGDESNTYRQCKCPGSLRIILDDLKIYLKNDK